MENNFNPFDGMGVAPSTGTSQSIEGVNVYQDGLCPNVDRQNESWLEEAIPEATDRGLGMGTDQQPGDMAVDDDSGISPFAESLSGDA